jgi:hypothetical protein
MSGTQKKSTKPRVDWSEVAWWTALLVLMGTILALATVANSG